MPCFTRIAAQIQSIIFYKPTVETLFKEIKDNSFELSLDKVLKSDKDINVLNFKSSINIQNLYFNFPGKQIFENANVIFPKNKILGLLGKSGEGKTTFINLVCGLIKPQSGKITIDGKFDINQMDIKDKWLKKLVIFHKTYIY